MGKNIVILCDGTSNEIEANRTNILRLFGCLQRDKTQLVYYDPGVGTFGSDDTFSRMRRKATELVGLAFGRGINENVMEAYRFLIENYDDGRSNNTEPDRIYLFGFSRGAYTVRVLAGLMHIMGRMDKEQLNLLPYAYRAYRSIGYRDDAKRIEEEERYSKTKDAFAEVGLYQRVLNPDAMPIHFMGLFDTVTSILEQTGRGMRFRTHAYTRRNPSVKNVRHAVAIDERRTMYAPQLFPSGGTFKPLLGSFEESEQDCQEVWFSGTHCDVGGGLPEALSGLAKIPLDWMINEADAKGLQVKRNVVERIVLGETGESYCKPQPLAKPFKSMTKGWPLVEWIPRPVHSFDDKGNEHSTLLLNRGRRRRIPEGAFIHPSVFERRGTSQDYDQPNLPKSYSVIEPLEGGETEWWNS
ncbi:Uncharacterized alpha/beta hydrolase domain [Cohaesibacter sp. ES.047]|uniref:DUF2235 domain-containing protein n=1 Tax=Cohaesibacter sp. ES.047 TaxID=1798205 RepID=UPI000BB8DCA0|nr:DUF2235 domain-containing protein [Cohaesibacter sp. ES.047]SNY92454.1 Uncharacterized alpha/beta hydrolase domain [Cohaesibacter sp. ES.047]